MLWVERTPKASELQENMEVYFNTLQGFILLSHGSTVGAGPTLSACVYAAVKRVVDSSFHLWKESVSSYGTDEKQSIPQLVGTVWEACSALQKTPGNNITAIGRAISQLTIAAVSATLVVIKEIIRSITSLLKIGNTNDNTSVVDSLENLLKQIQKIGEQIDEMGACLYPPQEVPVMKTAAEKISGIVDDMQKEVENLKGTSEGFLQACNGLKVSLAQLKSELDSSSSLDIESKLQKVDLNN
uniref:Cyclin-D1-binding protein 1-like N-terminal domain-containing protein n=1 Tax=Cannabis sativa TaxID=3483 RepID=A0A803PHJ7_CANSA